MKTRTEVLDKAEELKEFDGNDVQEEAYWILMDIAGYSDEDMASSLALWMRWLQSPKREGSIEAKAADMVHGFLVQ